MPLMGFGSRPDTTYVPENPGAKSDDNFVKVKIFNGHKGEVLGVMF